MVTMPRQNEVQLHFGTGLGAVQMTVEKRAIPLFFLLFFTFSEVFDGHVWPHYTMRSWPGRPAASVRGGGGVSGAQIEIDGAFDPWLGGGSGE